MNIIKEGNPNFYLLRFKCWVCECIFEANRDEYEVYCTDELGGKIYTVKCPCCGQKGNCRPIKGE